MVFTFKLYWRGGHLGHMTRNICVNFRFSTLKSFHMKFELKWSSGFREKDV